MSYENFTSLPPEQEQQFVVFERQSVESSQKAMVIGIVSGLVLGVFLIGLYLVNDAPAAMHTDALDDDMAAETPKKKKRVKEATPPSETAPSEAAPSEAAPSEAAPSEAATPPTPPPGATKAPPSAVVGE